MLLSDARVQGRSALRGLAATVSAALLVTALLVSTLLVPVATAVPAVGAAAQDDPVLLSQGRPAVASALERPELAARFAVDGDSLTRWSSAYSDPQWIWVDLQRKADVRRVEIDWETFYSTAYSIEVSDDAVNWRVLWSTDAGDGGADVIPVDGTGRYVRMYSTARSGTAGNSIWELRVFGVPVPKKEPAATTPSREPSPEPETEEPEPEPTSSAPAAPAPDPTPSDPVPERSGPPGSVLYYVVGKEPGGTVEKLNDIAERFLGDRDRWPEIAELTEGHRQPDGKYLTDPRTLTPGWVLKMPRDARGEELEFGPLPGFEPPSRTPSPSPSPSAEPTLEVAGLDEAAGSRPVGPAWYAAGAGLVLAALVWLGVWFLRRRRRSAEPFDDSLLRTDTSAAWTVDRSLRVLMAACERDGLELPGITGVFIEGSSLRLRLTNPAAPAPEPWSVSEDGQSWAAPLAKLQSGVASDGSTARFARLVSVGMSETGRVLVDFASARGVISLDGPTRARHEVLRRWLGELTGNPWSNDPRVVMVGNGLPQPEQVEHLAGIEQVAPELEVGEGGVLVLSQAPTTAQQDMLAARFASPDFTWVVIVLGSAPSARWRFTAGDDGWLRSGFLPDVRFDEQTAVRRGGE